MNKKRREKLRIAEKHLVTAQGIIERVCSEEQDSLDNIPENLQGGERYEEMESYIDKMEEAVDSVSSAVDRVREI